MAAVEWPLCELEAASDTELLTAYRSIYLSEYVQADVRDWAGRRVLFRAMSFNHAFSESSDYRSAAGVHDVDLSLARAHRIYWIKHTLHGEGVRIEVLAQQRRDSREQMKRRRTLVVLDNRYVVVLEPCNEKGFDFQFITAFAADRSYMEKIRRGATVLERRGAEKKMPQS